MCHKMGFPPTSTIGFGREEVSSAILVPKPPASITAFIATLSSEEIQVHGRTLSLKITNVARQRKDN
jgi:hypothetical protein